MLLFGTFEGDCKTGRKHKLSSAGCLADDDVVVVSDWMRYDSFCGLCAPYMLLIFIFCNWFICSDPSLLQ